MNDIKLVSLNRTDIELVRQWRNSTDVSAFMYTSDHITADQQEKWYNKISQENDSRYWMIDYNGKKLGLASITGINVALSSCYWAFYLGDTSVRGAGIGAKIEFNVLEYVFSVLKLNKLRCEVFVSNDKVIKMHEKFGFRREAYYREHCIKDKQKLDVVGLAILNSEWQQYRSLMQIKIYGSKN